MKDKVNEAVAWMIGNPDGTVNPIGAIYHHRESCQQHIDGYGGKLVASIIPLYTHPSRVPTFTCAECGSGPWAANLLQRTEQAESALAAATRRVAEVEADMRLYADDSADASRLGRLTQHWANQLEAALQEKRDGTG